MVPGSLSWRRAGGDPLDCRCDGAALQPQPDGTAAILLRCVPKVESNGLFRSLNKELDALRREHRRVHQANERLEERVKERTAQLARNAEELRRSEERFRALVQNASDIVAVLDSEGITRYVSPAVERVLGHKPEDRVGRRSLEEGNVHPEDIDRVRGVFAELAASPGGSATAEFRLRHADGGWRDLEAVGKNLLHDRSVGGIVVNYRDVTERKAFEERLHYRAFHDPLTGLPNRALFFNRLGQALARARRRDQTKVAVLFLDLDQFKVLNDSLGHEFGDALLLSVGERLRACLRPADTAARFGGDEFTVLLEDIPDASEASRVAERIRQELRRPFRLGGRDVFVTASIGVALNGASAGEEPGELLRNADLAMYRAKAAGRDWQAAFEPSSPPVP